MKEIELTQGQVAIVDDEDYEYLSQWKWYAQYYPRTKKFYAARTDRSEGKKVIYMIRVIMKTPKGMETDHINGDTLLNVKSNLRICTHSQNKANANFFISNKAKMKGVYIFANRFVSQIHKDGEKIYLGRYNTKEEAARAYDAKARELFGEFARLNFPET